jgi:hypothetical protein
MDGIQGATKKGAGKMPFAGFAGFAGFFSKSLPTVN